MWRDAFLLDEPVQHRSSPVSGIPGKPLGLEAKALLGSFDHCLRRTYLGLANGARRLNIDDDAELQPADGNEVKPPIVDPANAAIAET